VPVVRSEDIKFDYVAVGELLRTPEMEAEMVRRMANVMELAISRAPYAPSSDPHHVHYRDSFHLSHGRMGMPGAHTLNDRAWAMVENDAPDAIFIEYGNKHIARMHILLNALIEGAGD
jgi:hypothetical protein